MNKYLMYIKQNEHFKRYMYIWAIILIAFNVASFLIRPFIPGCEFDGSFWESWLFITIAFVGNPICAYYAFQAENGKEMFYNLPLLTISRACLFSMLFIGGILTVVPNCPGWIAPIVCLLILSFNAVAIIKAGWSADIVKQVDEKIKTETSYIRNLTAEAEGVLATAKCSEIGDECKKVYEAVRYSDPVSSSELSVIEARITIKMDELSNAVNKNNVASVKRITEELLVLIGDRNRKCKLYKG